MSIGDYSRNSRLGDYTQSRSLSDSNVVFLDDFTASNSLLNWKRRIEHQLKQIQRGRTSDHETSLPKDSPIFIHAASILAELPPILEEPTVGVNRDGTLLIEWHKIEQGKSTMFSLVLDGENLIYAILYLGETKTHGALSFSDDSIESIKNMLIKYFTVQTHASTAVR